MATNLLLIFLTPSISYSLLDRIQQNNPLEQHSQQLHLAPKKSVHTVGISLNFGLAEAVLAVEAPLTGPR